MKREWRADMATVYCIWGRVELSKIKTKTALDSARSSVKMVFSLSVNWVESPR